MHETAAHFHRGVRRFSRIQRGKGKKMATIDYGSGEREFRCTALTCMIYEHEFVSDVNPKITGDLIADTVGKITVSSNDVLHITDDGNYVTTVVDYTKVNWQAIFRALWAMMRTSYEISKLPGNTVLPDVPAYKTWEHELLSCEPDMENLATVVQRELMRGLFRAGAAASGENQQEAEEG